MKWIALTIIYVSLVILSSCKNHKQEVDDAITELEWIDSRFDSIGERKIQGYTSTIYVPGINDHEHSDSITISEKEFRDIQFNIYAVKENLEELSKALEKEYETE